MVVFLIIIIRTRIANSIIKIIKRIAIKKIKEKSNRVKLLGSNPHSKELYFSKYIFFNYIKRELYL